jgi:hypothetical protein
MIFRRRSLNDTSDASQFPYSQSMAKPMRKPMASSIERPQAASLKETWLPTIADLTTEPRLPSMPPPAELTLGPVDPAIDITSAFIRWLQSHPDIAGSYCAYQDLLQLYDHFQSASDWDDLPWRTMIQCFRQLTGRPKEYGYRRVNGRKKRVVIYFIPQELEHHANSI